MADSRKNKSASSSGTDKASGIINNKTGIDYHFFVAMYSCLNGYKIKQSNSSYEFKIRQECKGVGMFDDIVYEYRENESEEWTRLLVQIKYKQADNKIKTGNLLFNDKKETFSLTKFMKSIKEIEDIKNCYFIIYTSASLDLEDNGRLNKWHKKGVQEPITLLPSKVSCVPVFNKDTQYKFNDPENIPIFIEHSGIDKEEDWEAFLNKFVFVTGPSNLDRAETIIEETIEDILPKSTEIIWNRLYKIVDSGLKNRTEITSQEISELFETVEEEIQKGHYSKYEDCEIEYKCDIPEVKEFLSSELFTTLPFISNNPKLTLIKVNKEIKKLRQGNPDLKKFTMKHVYGIIEIKDLKKAASSNLLIINIKNNDQLDMFEMLKHDDQKYIIIISNAQNLSGIENCFKLYRDVDHSFKLLTDKSKQYVLNKQCVSMNGQKFSFRDILQLTSSRLTQQQEEWLNSVITEEILTCFFNKEYESLQLNFNQEDIKKLSVYIKRRLHCSKYSKIEKFKNLYKTSNNTIREDELCDVDDNTVLISDIPGMGKSSIVSSVFKELQKKHPEQIIIRLNFNDHTSSFSRQLALDNLQMIVDFIIIELLVKAKLSELSKNVLNYILQTKNTIFLFLDGFDEICPDYNDTVVNFIQSLMEYTNCKLFVTTRPGQIDILEQVLSTSALSIQPFSEEDKLLYLDKRLVSKNINTEVLLQKINEHSKLIELLGVPLLLKIVTDTLCYENTDKLNIDAIFNLSQLFKLFINQKFEIYSEEKKKQDITNLASQKDNKRTQEVYEEEHEILALRLLCSEEIGTCKNIDYEQITKIGLIIQANDDIITFIHRTFAEYFLATYIQKQFNKTEVTKLLLTKVLVSYDLTTLRQFINNYIGEKLNDDVSIDKYRRYVNDNYKTIEENNPISSILHTTVNDNNAETTTFILECFKQNQKMLDNITSYGNEIALDTAIDNSNIEIAKQIINYCDKNKMNKECKAYKFMFDKGVIDGETALHKAAIKGHTEVVRLLLDKGASVDITDTFGWTPLHRAASWGHTEVVNLLLDKGASVDITDTNGRTALHWAASDGHTAVVRLLLDKGASVDITDTNGRTALHVAASKDHRAVVSLLLDKGASVDIGSRYSMPALHRAASEGHTEVVNLLLDKGASMDIADTNGTSPLHWAAYNGRTEVVRLLLDKGASVDITNTNGMTALHEAATWGYTAVVNLLLDKGASVNVADTDGMTALHWAGAKTMGNTEVVNLLLDKGASVDIVDKYGATALHRAAGEGHIDIVNLLLEKGASVDIADTNGWTAVQWATRTDHYVVMNLLLDKSASET